MGDERRIEYFVNGEAEDSTEHKLKVEEILQRAGFTPATQYRLTRDEGQHAYTNYEEEVPLHSGERFTATFIGPTPTS